MARIGYGSTAASRTIPPMLRACATALLALAVTHLSHAQQPPVNGMRPSDPARHALVGATVFVAPGETIEKATILVRDGVIEAVGADLAAPAGYRVHDLAGKTVLAAFIEAALVVDSAEQHAAASRAVGAHWNQHVTPEVRGADLVLPDAALDALRAQGFALARLLPEDGIFRGTSDLRLLGRASERVLPRDFAGMPVQSIGPRAVDFSQFAAQTPGVQPARGDRDGRFPSSLMGSYALIRQTLSDAAWRAESRAVVDSLALPPEDMNALESLVPVVDGAHGVVVDAAEELDVARLVRLVREHAPKAPIAVLGGGLEFRAFAEVAATLESTGSALLLPIDFPQAPDLVSPMAADTISLRDLMTWRHAPTNPKRFIAQGTTVALTTHRMQDKGAFRRKLADAIAHGLTKDEALAALTTTPARLLGVDSRIGTLERGKIANILVAAGDPFDAQTKFEGLFVAGALTVTPPEAPALKAGSFTVAALVATPKPVAADLRLAIDPKAGSIKATWTEPNADAAKPDEPATKEQSATAKRASVSEDGRGSGMFDGAPFGFDGQVRISFAGAGDGATLTVEDGAGTRASFSMTRVAATDDSAAKKDETTPQDAKPEDAKPEDAKPEDAKDEDAKDEDAKDEPLPADDAEKAARAALWQEALPFPFGEYGVLVRPTATKAIVKGATIWTLSDSGTLVDADMLVDGGKIVAIGKDLAVPADAAVIDGRGMHVTPGLIDCHSHTGISGAVNEGTQASTAEVGIGDVIDPTDINWYRQLAGGLTAANQLHGSANPIGGRNAVVKLHWGEGAERFLFDEAPTGIKFALGENVVRSKSRYPNTRMGVATFLEDSFKAAQAYRARQQAYAALDEAARAKTLRPRVDFELEALAEILEGTRLVHCHSYRQDEILMLLDVADRFGFRVATLQHVLEGFKVAPEIARHGAGASSFSDWWAYKIEVMDAIPWNGAMLHNAGVLVSFNSDSDELARRMNMEAAKAVRYGNLPPDEALKLVTLNPAKQLRIDHRTGSLEVGKDADFAVWNGDPLSAFTRCEETWVDGVRRYRRADDEAARDEVRKARADLIAKATATPAERAGPASGDAQRSRRGRPSLLDRMLEEREETIWLRLARGQDPFATRQGECGCGDLVMGLPAAEAELLESSGAREGARSSAVESTIGGMR
jgi:N-acetylglucosamine-6-phosphate deacetylase